MALSVVVTDARQVGTDPAGSAAAAVAAACLAICRQRKHACLLPAIKRCACLSAVRISLHVSARNRLQV